MGAPLASGGWGVPAGDINVMAHSLGNLVMWDALRICANRMPGTDLVNNVISVEAAVWPEAFAAQIPEEYVSPDAPIIYPTITGTLPLINHSWKFWFRQTGAEAASAATGQIYHSYLANDSSLVAMRWGDLMLHADTNDPPNGYNHFNRDHLSFNPPAPRCATNLGDVPTLMLHGQRLPSKQYCYNESDLNLPVGTQPNPLSDNVDHDAGAFPSEGWRTTKHSELKDQPIYYPGGEIGDTL